MVTGVGNGQHGILEDNLAPSEVLNGWLHGYGLASVLETWLLYWRFGWLLSGPASGAMAITGTAAHYDCYCQLGRDAEEPKAQHRTYAT